MINISLVLVFALYDKNYKMQYDIIIQKSNIYMFFIRYENTFKVNLAAKFSRKLYSSLFIYIYIFFCMYFHCVTPFVILCRQCDINFAQGVNIPLCC